MNNGLISDNFTTKFFGSDIENESIVKWQCVKF